MRTQRTHQRLGLSQSRLSLAPLALAWRHCISGTLEGGRLIKQVFAIARIAQLLGGLGELLGALAVDCSAADREGLGHAVFSAGRISNI